MRLQQNFARTHLLPSTGLCVCVLPRNHLFTYNYMLAIFKNICQHTPFLLKSDNNAYYLGWFCSHFECNSLNTFGVKMFRTTAVQKSKHTFYAQYIFPASYGARDKQKGFHVIIA
jgi:hypothetical protein